MADRQRKPRWDAYCASLDGRWRDSYRRRPVDCSQKGWRCDVLACQRTLVNGRGWGGYCMWAWVFCQQPQRRCHFIPQASTRSRSRGDQHSTLLMLEAPGSWLYLPGRFAPTGSLMSRASQLNSTKWRRRSNAARILNVFNWLDMAQSASFGLIADPGRVLKIWSGGVSAASRGACFVACPADMFRLSRAARMAVGRSTCQLAHRPGCGNTKQCFAKPALRPCYVFQHPVKLAEAI